MTIDANSEFISNLVIIQLRARYVRSFSSVGVCRSRASACTASEVRARVRSSCHDQLRSPVAAAAAAATGGGSATLRKTKVVYRPAGDESGSEQECSVRRVDVRQLQLQVRMQSRLMSRSRVTE